MVIVKTVEEFARQNESQLKNFMKYKARIYDENIINDTVQEFYIKLIETKALESYNEEEGGFNTYIIRLFCWLFPILRKRNFRNIVTKRVYLKDGDGEPVYATDEKGDIVVDCKGRKKKVYANEEIIYPMISTYTENFECSQENYSDIYNFVSDKNALFKLSPQCVESNVLLDEERKLEAKYEHFLDHIKNTEPPHKAKKMVTVLERRYEGCSSSVIAEMLGVSDNMVKLIKSHLREKYYEWDEVKVE